MGSPFPPWFVALEDDYIGDDYIGDDYICDGAPPLEDVRQCGSAIPLNTHSRNCESCDGEKKADMRQRDAV
jgi:hypothetical protein